MYSYLISNKMARRELIKSRDFQKLCILGYCCMQIITRSFEIQYFHNGCPQTDQTEVIENNALNIIQENPQTSTV